MTPTIPSPPPEDPVPGREPLDEAIASARQTRRGGISVQTLTVASLASAAASFTVSRLWGAGTVIGAALTPVVVALVSEFLHRPVDRVSATAQRVAPVVRRRPSAADPGDPHPPTDDPAPQADWAPVSYGEPARAAWRPRWRPVLLTGLLAFLIVASVITIPELLVGHSITGASGPATFVPVSGSTPAPAPTQTAPATTTTAAPQQPTTATTPTTTQTAPQQTTPTTATTPTTPATPTTPTTSTPSTPAAPTPGAGTP